MFIKFISFQNDVIRGAKGKQQENEIAPLR